MFQGCGEFVKNSNDKSNTWRERRFLWFYLWSVTANPKDPVRNMSHPSCTVSVGVRFHPQPFIMWMRGWENGAQVFHVFLHCCLWCRLTRSLMPAVAIPVCKQTFTWVVDCWIHGNFHVWTNFVLKFLECPYPSICGMWCPEYPPPPHPPTPPRNENCQAGWDSGFELVQS